MSGNPPKILRKKETALIIISATVYIVSYLGRYSFNANIPAIMDEYGISHTTAGLVTTLFFFGYGFGQFLNGILCKFYPKRFIVPTVLFISALINCAVYLGIPIYSVKYLWLINGISLSVLWPTLILTISEFVSRDNIKTAVLIMSTTTALGNFFTYGLSGIFSSLNSYKLIFIAAALIMSVIAFAWFFAFPSLIGTVVAEKTQDSSNRKVGKSEKSKAIFVLIVVLAVFAVADNLIKDGLHTWIPSVLSETFGVKQSNSIFLTMFLNLLGLCGAYVATVLHKKISDFVLSITVFYGITTAFLFGIIFSLNTSAVVVYVFFGLILLSTHAINNIVTSMAPMYMRDEVNAGTLSGVLNGCCYVGSTVSSYGLGKIADKSNWNAVFVFLTAVSVFVMLIGLLYFLIKKIYHKKEEKI